MTHHLTADLIAEALDDLDELAICASRSLTFDKPTKGGQVRVTLWRWDDDKAHDVEVECRTFRLVEVES